MTRWPVIVTPGSWTLWLTVPPVTRAFFSAQSEAYGQLLGRPSESRGEEKVASHCAVPGHGHHPSTTLPSSGHRVHIYVTTCLMTASISRQQTREVRPLSIAVPKVPSAQHGTGLRYVFPGWRSKFSYNLQCGGALASCLPSSTLLLIPTWPPKPARLDLTLVGHKYDDEHHYHLAHSGFAATCCYRLGHYTSKAS